MKVIVNLSVEVDPAAWSLEYGVEGHYAIRDDVREHISSGIQEHFRSILGDEAITVTVR